MSLVAVWCNEEAAPSIWLATDSRITGNAGLLIDEGGKLFSLPVICRGPDEHGFFNAPYHAQEVGLACVGGSLIYQHVYACLVPVLSNLIGSKHTGAPALEDVAEAVGRVTTLYVSSLGQQNPFAHNVGLVLVGYCFSHQRQEAYEFSPRFEEELFQQFEPIRLDLAQGNTRFFGDRIEDAVRALAEERERVRGEHPVNWHRAPIRVLRSFIDDPAFPTIGGDIQFGYVGGPSFARLTTTAPRVHGQPEAYMRLNNIDLDEIGPVGPCQIGLGSMLGLSSSEPRPRRDPGNPAETP